MNLKNCTMCLLFLLLVPLFCVAQTVSNANFYQEGKTVIITYNLDKSADVSVRVSADGGKTFSAPLTKVTGNVGRNVPAGRNRIVWNALDEWEKVIGENFVFQVEAGGGNGIHNGHKYVDLGLPSGLLWATCNVGANSPEEYGNYYAWGETQPKSTYDRSTHKYGYYNYTASPNYGMTKYNKTDNKTTLELADDAARANWGGKWRMPTLDEQKELLNNCTWTWITKNGINGYEVKSKTNGYTIFLPAAGFRDGSNLYSAGEYGDYWSSSLSSGSPGNAYFLYFYSDDHYWGYGSRYYGLSVRAVFKP